MDDQCLFDKKEVELLPSGIYTGEFLSADYRKSNAGNIYLLCCIKITQGEYQDRIVFDHFHVFSNKPKFRAEQIERISKVRGLVGLSKGATPKMLIGKPFLIEIGQVLDSNLRFVNKVVKYSKLS